MDKFVHLFSDGYQVTCECMSKIRREYEERIHGKMRQAIRVQAEMPCKSPEEIANAVALAKYMYETAGTFD